MRHVIDYILQIINVQFNKTGNSGTFGDDDFKNALYMIDIGQNDLSGAFLDNHLTKPQLPNITSFLDEIRSAISVCSIFSSLTFFFFFQLYIYNAM